MLGLDRARQADPSDLGLLRDLERVASVDSEVVHRAPELGVPEPQLHRAQVLRPPINQRGLRSTKRMCSVLGPVVAGVLDPCAPHAGVLPHSDVQRTMQAAGEQEVSNFSSACRLDLGSDAALRSSASADTFIP